MPTEHRDITFSKAEVWAAVIDYCLRHDVVLPDADIEDMETTQKGDGDLNLDITYKAPAKGKKVTIRHAQLGAALINYCRLISVPLPRVGMKGLNKAGDGILLSIRIDRTPAKNT